VEISAYQVFDYIVVNDDLERAFDELRAIVVAARCRRERRQGAAQRLLEEWEAGPYGGLKRE
jgi:guanylate kinase